MVAAPSGAGKTTLVRALLERRPAIELSISCTTRKPRPGETHGVDYFFVSSEEFEQRRARGEFLEWAEVHGNLYATSRAWIDQRMSAGTDILLEIDCQGAVQVQQLFPDAVGIFIAPPSMEALRQRLTGRAQDTAEVIERRLAAAASEMQQASRFQYVIINQDFDTACRDLLAVVDAAGLRFAKQRSRYPRLFGLWGL